MDLQLTGGPSEKTSLENEYHLEIKIESVSLTKHQPNDIQLIFIFGDLVNEMNAESHESFSNRKQLYIVHSIPSSLSEKLLNIPIMIYVASLTDMKTLGKLSMFDYKRLNV